MINKFSIFNGSKCFSSGIFQNYLLVMPAKKHIKYLSSTTQIDSWKYNGMSEENIEIITTSDSNFASNVYEHHLLLDKNFSRLCLINDIFINKKLYIYIYIHIYI